MNKRLSWWIEGIPDLQSALSRLDKLAYADVISKNLTQLFNRASKTGAQGGGTPVDTGELRLSRGMQMRKRRNSFEGAFGYRAPHAPHVEFGHRTRGGGYVSGQKYLQQNVNKQRPILKRDIDKALAKAIRKK